MNFFTRYLMKKAARAADDGIMITLPSADKIKFQEQMLIDILMRNGVDPNAIKSEQMLDNVLNQIEAVEKQNLANNIRAEARKAEKSGIMKSAKVMDMEGQEIPQGSRIMGGKEVKETEAEIAERIKNQNKQSLEKMKEKSKKKQDRMDDIFGDFDGLDDFAKGGRVGLKLGVGKEGLKALAKKLGMKFASDLEQPPKSKLRNMFKDFESRNPDPKRELTDDEIEDLAGEVGELDAYNFDGTVGSANRIRQEQKDYEARMFQEYKAGRLDPEPGDTSRGRLQFLRNKMEEMEMSGDRKLMTRDEIEELIDLENRYDYLDLVEKAEDSTRKMTDADIKKLREYNDSNYQGVLKAIDKTKIKKASGGIARLGFKAGGIDKARRAFLKVLGAGAATVGAVKTGLLKLGGKQAVKEVVKTAPAPGKPEWFDPLVNKVISQGQDVTKDVATLDRTIVHRYKLDTDETVDVTQYLDSGDIKVTYDSPNNMAGEYIDLNYKAPEMLEEGKVVPADFKAIESEPRGVRSGPDDYDIEFDGENVVENVDELMSDTTKLKSLGGKNPSMREILEGTKKKKRVQAINEDNVEQAEYLDTKYGPGGDYASGGIARMLGE